MPNEFEVELKFSASEMQKLMNKKPENIIVVAKLYHTGKGNVVRAHANHRKSKDYIDGCPMPCDGPQPPGPPQHENGDKRERIPENLTGRDIR